MKKPEQTVIYFVDFKAQTLTKIEVHNNKAKTIEVIEVLKKEVAKAS